MANKERIAKLENEARWKRVKILFWFLMGLGVVLVIPATRYELLGLLRHERFYRGRPTSYWIYELRREAWGDPATIKSLKDGGPKAVPMLVEALKREDAQDRTYAAMALGYLGKSAQDAVPALIQALGDDAASVRSFAVHALIPFDSAAKATVPVALQMSDDPTRAESIGHTGDGLLILRQMNSGAVVPILKEALKDEDSLMRVKAAYSLVILDPSAKALVVPVAVEALKDKAYQVRQFAALTLGLCGPAAKVAVPALIEALSNEESNTRNLAAQAVGRIEPERLVPILVGMLKNKNARMRIVGAEALGSSSSIMGTRSLAAVPALTEALNDKSQGVRDAVAFALKMIRLNVH